VLNNNTSNLNPTYNKANINNFSNDNAISHINNNSSNYPLN